MFSAGAARIFARGTYVVIARSVVYAATGIRKGA